VTRAASAQYVRGVLEKYGTLYNAAAATLTSTPLGGRIPAFVMAADGEPWVVRHYHRGGAAARWLDDRYVRTGGSRSLHELRVSAAARARGIATPLVMAAIDYPAGAFIRHDIATKFVPHARDLSDVLFGGPVTESMLDRIAVLIQQIVQQGMMHRDLNLKNILLSDTRAWVIDLDRCTMRKKRRTSDALAMQKRFVRSLEKWEQIKEQAVKHSHRVRLEQAFHA
jgi:3-deoxy-D-manno-octulosonic acid kinase